MAGRPQFDTDDDGDFDEDDLIDGKPPGGKESDSMLLDITILGDTAYTPDADAGDIPDEDLVKRRAYPFWQIIE